jgi:hypothetical protein
MGKIMEKDNKLVAMVGERHRGKSNNSSVGKTFVTTRFYADVLEGTEGVCLKHWVDSRYRNEWIKLYLGTNEGGQKLKKTFPMDCVKLKE